MGNRLAALLWVCALWTPGCGDDGGADDDDEPAEVARLEVVPGGMLLEPGESRAVTVVAYDAVDSVVIVDAVLETSDPDALALSDDGIIAGDVAGSALLTARVGDIVSPAVLVTVADLVDGTVRVNDDQVIAAATEIDPDTFRYDVVLRDIAPPAVGAILIANETAAIAGRVVASEVEGDEVKVVVQAVPVAELFDALSIDVSFDLGDDVMARRRAALPHELEFDFGLFHCEADADVEPLVSAQPLGLEVRVGVRGRFWIEDSLFGGFEGVGLSVTTTTSTTVTGDVRLRAGLTAELTCTAPLAEVPLPIVPAWMKVLVEPTIPLDVGFDLQASLFAAEVNIALAGTVTDERTFGFECFAGALCGLFADGERSYALDIPDVSLPTSIADSLRLEAELYAYAKIGLSLRFLLGALGRDTNFDIVEARLGPRFTLDYQHPRAQASDQATTYASSYAFDVRGEIRFSDDVEDKLRWFDDLIEVKPPTLASVTLPLGRSPTGTLTATVAQLDHSLGQSVDLIASLDPTTLSFDSTPNVDRIEIYEQLEDGLLVLVDAVEPTASGQTDFVVSWTPTSADEGAHTFVAFVVPDRFYLVPLELEPDARMVIDVVGGSCGNGACAVPESPLDCPTDCPHTCGDMLCTGTETTATCAVDCPAPTETCNYIDDDGDGLVDDGFVYAQSAGSLATIVEAVYTGVFWIGKGPTSLALAWTPGEGIATDVLRLRMLDLDGAPIAAATTVTTNQPSNYHEPIWMGDRFMTGHTRRQYDCGGIASTTCPTELHAYSATGTPLLGPTQVAVDTPLVHTGPLIGGEYTLVFPIASGPGDVRLRSYTTTGAAGALDRPLFSLASGEALHAIVGATSGTRVYWVYATSAPAISMRVTNLAGDTVSGPFVLSSSGTMPSPRAGRQLIVHDGVVHVLFNDATTSSTYLGRWDLDGNALGPPTQVAPIAAGHAMDRHGDQIYVVVGGGTSPDQMRVARVALDGTLIQPPSAIALPASENSVAVAAVPNGVVVATGDAANQLSWARYACP